MTKVRNGVMENLRYLCLIGVIALGLLSIVGSNGNGNGGDAGPSSLPIGTYSSNDHNIALQSDETFTLCNYANANDERNFTIGGTYTYTLDGTTDGNTYGKLTFTVTSLELEGAEVSTLYLDDDEDARSYTEIGDVLEGWWAYSDLITYGGKMRVWFNWPGIPRENNYWEGHNELFSGDP